MRQIPHRHLEVSMFGRRALMPTFLIGVAIMAVATVGCDNKRTKLTDEQLEVGLPSRGEVPPSERVKLDPRCEVNQQVTEPEEGTAEWVLHDLIAAASEANEAGADDAALFQRFYAHFSSETAERWAKDQYWGRFKQHVSKYVDAESIHDHAFTICERKTETPDTTRFAIKSHDTTKSNPPITLREMPDGKFRVVFFTP